MKICELKKKKVCENLVRENIFSELENYMRKNIKTLYIGCCIEKIV
jgi:hypothetical protein